MRIRVQHVGNGMHPSERVVEVETPEGRVRLTVDRSYLHDNRLEVGYPVGKSNGKVLVELPRETTSGQWRVWVFARDLEDVDRMEGAT